MRIAIIQPRLSYYNGGGEKYPMDAIRHISSITNDIYFDVYTAKTLLPETTNYASFKASINPKKVRIIEKDVPSKYAYLYNIQAGEDRFRWDAESLYFSNLVYEDLCKNKPDLIWVYYIMDGLVKPVNVPATLHLLGYPRTVSDYREALLAQYERIVPISENVLQKWNGLLNRKISTKDILSQGVDIHLECKEIPIFKKETFSIVFAGRLIERKGILTLLEALENIISITKRKVNLYILGEGPYSDSIKCHISDHGLQNVVHMVGYKNDLHNYFHNANMCIFPSYEGEGLMSVVLESMYYNGLVLTTTNNGNEEAITNGINGFLVEPRNPNSLAEKILYVIEHETNLAPMRQNAAIIIRDKYSWDKYATRFRDICQSVLDHSKLSELS